jgi:hypothetical protein
MPGQSDPYVATQGVSYATPKTQYEPAQNAATDKRITRPMLGLKLFEAAQATLTGIELVRMLRKGQLRSKDMRDSPWSNSSTNWPRSYPTDRGWYHPAYQYTRICDKAFMYQGWIHQNGSTSLN